MLEILSYTFFRNALGAGVLLACIAAVLGVFVVMRKEANAPHAISNFLFLGVAVSLLLDGAYYVYALAFAVFGALTLFFIERKGRISKESTKEIVSQGAMASAIFALSFLEHVSVDINAYLFGSILMVQTSDLWMISALLLIVALVFFFFGKKFIANILSPDIAKSAGTPTSLYDACFLVLLSLFIALSIKIFGILLIAAFLVLPANIGKLLASKLQGVFTISVVVAIFSVVTGLFSAHALATAAGATIVLVLIIIFFFSFLLKK